MPKFGTRSALFGYFWAWILYQRPRICQKRVFLTHTVNFGIGTTYSKGTGSAFSEVPSPGLGPLYKVSQFYLYLSNKNKIQVSCFYFFCRTSKLQLWTSDSQFPNFFFRKHIQKCKKASHLLLYELQEAPKQVNIYSVSTVETLEQGVNI